MWLTWLSEQRFRVPCGGSLAQLSSWCICGTQSKWPWYRSRLDSCAFRWKFPCTNRCCCCWWHRRMWWWSSLAHLWMANCRELRYRPRSRNNRATHKRLGRMAEHDWDRCRCLYESENKCNSIYNHIHVSPVERERWELMIQMMKIN